MSRRIDGYDGHRPVDYTRELHTTKEATGDLGTEAIETVVNTQARRSPSLQGRVTKAPEKGHKMHKAAKSALKIP